jgi:Mg-chelatase subunit ChlI
MLVGSMNPEEGELRPQFLDRFALSVWAGHIESPETRKEIARRVLDFETDPEAFRKRFEKEEENLCAMLGSARKRLPATELPAFCFDLAIDICARAKAAGHRADISLLKAARALAAFLESPEVSPQHIFEAARYVLSHRMARSPGEDHRQREGRLGKIIEQSASARQYSDSDLDSGDDGKQGKKAEGEKEGEAAKAAGDDLRLSESETFAESEETGEVPGPAAAGSLMFEYIKKKAPKPS